MNSRVACSARDVTKLIPGARVPSYILQSCSLDVPRGGLTALVGPSGAGKTSLMYCLAGLDQPDRGSVALLGADIYGINQESRSKFLREHVGFVFQEYNLVKYLTVEENLRLPFVLGRRKLSEDSLHQCLERFGLLGQKKNRVATLSGGEQQRAALCRALLLQPELVFADEPTGALDSSNTAVVLGTLREMADRGCTVVMVTHDVESAALADTIVFMKDGRISSITGRLPAGEIMNMSRRLGSDHA